jgi:hypothetical protein
MSKLTNEVIVAVSIVTIFKKKLTLSIQSKGAIAQITEDDILGKNVTVYFWMSV